MYKKGSNIKTYPYENGKILATIVVGGNWVSNPYENDLIADGWVRYTPPTPPPYVPTREEKINAEIRARYSSDDEYMLLREKAAGKEGADERFAEYNAFVESVLAKYPEEG